MAKYSTSQILYKSTGSGALIDIDAKSRTLSFYGSVFGNVDSDGDFFERTAWDKSISENGPAGKNRIKFLREHDMGKPVSKFEQLLTDDYGLKATVTVSDNSMKIDYIKDMFILMDEGVIDEFSVGARLLRGDWDDSKDAFGIKEAQLYEISAVTYAANENAKLVDLKSLSTDQIQQVTSQMEKAAKLLRKGNLTDETCKTIEYQIMTWKSLISLTPNQSDSPKPNTDGRVNDDLKSISEQLKSLTQHIGEQKWQQKAIT